MFAQREEIRESSQTAGKGLVELSYQRPTKTEPEREATRKKKSHRVCNCVMLQSSTGRVPVKFVRIFLQDGQMAGERASATYSPRREESRQILEGSEPGMLQE